MKKSFLIMTAMLCGIFVACDDDNDTESDDATGSGELATAYSIFDEDNVTIMLDGDDVIIETNGLPNHTSPYWSPNHELYVEATVATGLAPGYTDDFSGSYSVTLPANPTQASSSSATSLGAIGIAVSGSMIYNDSEGPNVPLDDAATSLDFSGAHTGPQSYHYHLEPTAWSEDDDALIGVISDGFFLYGRKCTSTGDYPSDLDESGGHTSSTKYNTDGEEYHYHIENELYLNTYYILFPGDYQGTPNAIR